MVNLSETFEKLQGVLAAEIELGDRVNGLDEITGRKIRRSAIKKYLQDIDNVLAPVLRAVKNDLPSLPSEEPIQWAQSLLHMASCQVLEVDTTGLEERDELCRVTLANVGGALFDDILIKPSVPITVEVTAVNGITQEQLNDAPSLIDVWERIREGMQGRYIVSFAQEWDRKQLEKAAQRHSLPPIYFLGEDLQRRLTEYYSKEYYLKLTDIAERITGQPLSPNATAIERVKAQCAIIAGMAAAITDVRPPRPRRSQPQQSTRTTEQPDDGGLGDLDDHPF